METEVIVKRWGNSLGVVLPNDIVKLGQISENERIIIDIKKRQVGKEFMGLLKGWPKNPQKAKDEARKGWE